MDHPSGRQFSVSEVSEVAAIPPPRRSAALLYGHAAFGYGHLSRCRKIARRLVENFPFEAYVVSSSPEFPPDEPHEAIHEVVLPAFRIGSPDFLPDGLPIPDRASSLAHVPVDQLSAHRGRLLLALATRIAPDAVLLEGFPFIRPLQALEECGPTLRHLGQHSPRTLRCAGFNGVATSLYVEEHAALIEDTLREQLDRLFVYVDPVERTGLIARSPWLRTIEAKVQMTGYVVGPPPEKADAPPRILATFGSGVDAFRKIVLVVEAFFEFSVSRPGFALDVVTGGQLPDRGFREIARLVDGRRDVRLGRVVPGLGRRLNHYQLVISMGGYNSCTELYQASTRGLVVPRFAPDFAEQMEQARKFQQLGAIERIVDAGTTSPGGLAEVLTRTLAAPPSPRLPIDIGGAEVAARSLAGATPPAARPA